ncbi:hypothetical protein [Methylovorus glucosotrophus]|uniref:Uncharacterized protein n=1 Tax=Methylovorus glucosotrophus (strain SIP3-4) TaxID=582744 RepID=C6XDF8_METGS|nr:hypothetical protein [Methylovorus glucosotrophus]ACT50583.1 hypothetical protein Msip34_1337 [Methylovorus glucosotrophus SIP3-4]
MATQLKVQVLGVGEIENGTSRNGGAWHRRTLQIWTGEIAGNHSVYADEDTLKNLMPGNYMVDVSPRAGDRGRVEFVITGITPVTPAQEVRKQS